MEYKKGQIIEWCDEQFEILEVHSNDTGKVKQGNDIIINFKFNYGGEWAKIISKKSPNTKQ